MNDKEPKIALVTGGGEGIGKAASMALARDGYFVGVLGRTPDDLETTTDEIIKLGGHAMPLAADITVPEKLDAAIQELGNRTGRIDFLFANAGINGLWAPVEELSLEEWSKVIEINQTGTFATIKLALPFLRKSKTASIAVTSSVNGTRMFSNTGASAYASSKAAQVALTKMLALELGPAGIRINAICPGSIESNIQDNTQTKGLEGVKMDIDYEDGKIPLTGGKPGKAGDVADLVVFLASPSSKHITGSVIFIDGAQSLLMG